MPLSVSAAPGGKRSYKERHAKSHNCLKQARNDGFLVGRRGQLCRGKVCRWAKCQKSIRFKCPAYLWAIAEFERLQLAGSISDTFGRVKSDTKVAPPKDTRYDERAEYRDFLRELGRGSRYVGFGKEADNCGRWGMLKECEQGHKILKRLVCGREWCPVCGQDDSEHHHRRISRLIDRVFSMDSVGYFVFEVPLAQRGYFEDVGMLRAASFYLSKMLKREGFSKAVRRWHFYGKARVKEAKKLNLDKYHPHLNVLCDVSGGWADWDSCSEVGTGFVDKELIRRLRRLWSEWLRDNTDGMYRVAPVYYAFSDDVSKIWHWARYITRSTFKVLTDSNRHIASDLYQFSNTSWWGVFSDDDKARGRARFEAWLETLPEGKRHNAVDVAAHDAYETGLCPVCGAATKLVDGVVKCDNYDVITDYGGGLYYVHSPPGVEVLYAS
ncbi:hypothetical protein ES705_26509 [subsurface metagenome]